MNNLASIKTRLNRATKVLDRRIAEARVMATNSKQIREEIEVNLNDVELYNKVAITLASIGEQRQFDAQQKIEELVTRGLRSIFDEDLSFNLVATQRGKTPEIKFLVKSRGLNGASVETSVMDSRGGGMAATVGFLLRLVVLLLNKDIKEPILVLDESFSHVSAEYRRPLLEFMLELVNKTKVQIVVVTHDDIFLEYADKRYKLKQLNGVTKAEEF